MKKTSILVTLVLVLVLVSFSLSCSSSSTSTPESTIKLFFSSFNDNDIDKMASCLIPKFREEALASNEPFPEWIEGLTFYNVKPNLISMNDDRAEVYVEWDMKIVETEWMEEMGGLNDIDTTQHYSGIVMLERRGSEWLIAELSTSDRSEYEETDRVKLYPDLSLDTSDISFSNNSPNEGENITISATIHNIGDVDAEDASILFLDGEPKWGNQIGEAIVTVPSGGSAEASVSWTAIPGDHVIYVGTSPFNTFLENDYSNNAAFKSIHVTGPAVVADAGGPYIGDEGYPVIFYAGGSTDPSGAPLQYRWDYNSDGNWDISWSKIGATAIGATVWADDGNRSVTVEVSNGVLSSRDTVNVIVRNVVPTVQIVAETQTPGDSHVMFDGSNFTDPGIEDTHTIEWDFGDGEGATGTLSPTHTYDETGEYTVTLTVTDDDGGVGTDTLTVTVDTVSAISVAVDDGYNIYEDTILEVVAPGVLTNDSDVEPTAILVDNVNKGALALNSDGSFTYTPDADFNGSDTFTYKAVARAAESNVATVTITVNPVNDWPDVMAGSDQTINEGDTVAFSGSFTDPDSGNFSIEWDFGDGEYATGTLSPTHVYTEGGVYTVILMVRDDEGSVGWDSLTVTVN